MTDYQLVLTHWADKMNTDAKTLKVFVDSLHLEVTKGFDVVTRVAVEELSVYLPEDMKQKEFADAVEESLAYAVLGGYMLYLVEQKRDPEKENALAYEETGKLGYVWMQAYEQDQTSSLLSRIDPIISALISAIESAQINKLLLEYPVLGEKPYKHVGQIISFQNWAAHQGYIFGMLEQELQLQKKSEE